MTISSLAPVLYLFPSQQPGHEATIKPQLAIEFIFARLILFCKENLYLADTNKNNSKYLHISYRVYDILCTGFRIKFNHA